MQNIWTRIETWLKQHVPEMAVNLLPGAVDTEIKEAETALGVTFTNDFKACYRIHNGQHELATPMVGEWQLLSLQDMVLDWKRMKELYDAGKLNSDETITLSGPVRADWWNPKWIGFATNGGGDLFCLDFDPASGGKKGQVVTFWHMTPNREVLASSLQEWLENFFNDLKKGKYRIEDDELVRVKA